ncbi:unnamed protein product, partial [Urochloa humidicola]
MLYPHLTRPAAIPSGSAFPSVAGDGRPVVVNELPLLLRIPYLRFPAGIPPPHASPPAPSRAAVASLLPSLKRARMPALESPRNWSIAHSLANVRGCRLVINSCIWAMA